MYIVQSICGCLDPIKLSIINYLSSNNLTMQVIQEQKTTDHFVNEQEKIMLNKNQEDRSNQFNKQQQGQFKEKRGGDNIQQYIDDVYWYPQEVERNLMDLCKFVYKKKFLILQNYLNSPPQGFDKIYDSQDEMKLNIYSKIQILPQKRINIYRFAFRLKQRIQNYVNWVTDQILPFQTLLQQSNVIKTDQSQISLTQRQYKKLLVINQHQFLVASKTQIIRDKQQQELENQQNKVNVYTTIFSVKDKPATYPFSQGWINLCGIKVRNETEQYLIFDGYMNIQLDVNVSPTMLKQPLAKQIRIFTQKMINSIQRK